MGDAGETPFFILGADRSGTTLLRSLLAQRFAVAIPPESEFIRDLAGWRVGPPPTALEVERLRREVWSHPRVRSWGLAGPPDASPVSGAGGPPERQLSREEVFRDVVSEPYQAYAARMGVHRWGDKTPSYLDHLELLAGIWPGCRFVFVERDGRDVFCSIRRLPFGPNTPAAAAHVWNDALMTRDHAARRFPGRTRTITYEALVATPDRVVDELGEWLGLDPGGEPSEDAVVDPERAAWFPRLRDAVDAGSVGRWRRDLSDAEVARYEEVAGGALADRGYELSGVSPGTGRPARFLGPVTEWALRGWHFVVLRLWRERGRELRYVVARKLRR